jgi:hypothetical protein
MKFNRQAPERSPNEDLKQIKQLLISKVNNQISYD